VRPHRHVLLQHSDAGMAGSIARTCTEDDTDADRCSYEEQRNKRVKRMKEMMEPLVRAGKEW
jgi:hypothetical protein